MMRNLLLLQLGFNVLMLLGLLVLARFSLKSEPARRASQPEPVAPSPRKERSLFKTRKRAEASRELAPAMGDLVERAEAEELAAESALRARLARYSGRAANA